MKKRRGSITFFMSIVYLVLITFALGIVEGYRIKYLYAKQEELGRLALHNLKSDYLSDIFDEYGLMFYDDKSSNSKLILDNTFETGFKTEPDVVYFQDLIQRKDRTAEYHFPTFRPQNYSYERIRKEMDYQTLVDAKKEAILFARDKVPFSIAGDWLEKIKMWKKGLKADEWIKKKEKLMKNLKANDDMLIVLFKELDGAIINPDTHLVSVKEDGINGYNRNDNDKYRKVSEINGRMEIPDSIRSDMAERQYIYTDYLKEIRYFYEGEKSIIDSYYPEDPEINIIEKFVRFNEFRREKRENQESVKEGEEKLRDYYYSTVNAYNTAANLLDRFKESAKEIRSFLGKLEMADIGISTKESMRKELQNILYQYEESPTTGRANNFLYIKTGLEQMKEEVLEDKNVAAGLLNEAKNLLNEYERAEKDGKEWDTEREEKFLQRLEDHIQSQTRRDTYIYYVLKYEGYKERDTTHSQEGLEKKKESLEQNAVSQEMQEQALLIIEPSLNEDRLPSKTLLPGSDSADEGVPTIDDSILDQVMSAFTQMVDGVILNEYYFLVFSHFALQKEDDMAISGYLRSDHVRKGELEYLLFGQGEAANRGLMIAVLFAIRLAFNIIALVADLQKMQIVTSMATAIAGWWSLGAGTAILTAVIVGVWAALESSADIFMLFRGKRVPLIKTPNTWYTSLSGALGDLATEAAEGAADAALGLMEKSSEVFRDTISQLITVKDTEIMNELNFRVAEKADEIKSHVAALDNQIRSIVGNALYKVVEGEKAAKEKALQELVELGVDKGQAQAILDRAFSTLDQMQNTFIDNVYTKKVEAVEASIKATTEKIREVTNSIQKKGEDWIREKITDLGDELGKMTKKGIEAQKQIIKQKIKDKFGSGSQPDGNKTISKNWREYIGFNYVDYLRLFLFVGSINGDKQWLRAMDLIQQNQQKHIPEFYILDCEREFEIKSSVNYTPLFLPEHKWFSGKYQVDVVTEGRY